MAEATQIIRLVIDSSKAVEGSAAATRALEKLERSTASMDGALTRMEAGLGRVGGMVKAHLALMVAELGARFIQTGKDALKAVAGLDELAEQMGITTVGLQALQFSAVQNGVKLEQLETGISKFSQKMGEAAGGSKDMVEALTALGVKNLDVQGKLRPTETLLAEVASAITKIEDPARRSAAAVDFFGKAGARMLPMLSDVAAGTDKMAAKAAAAGAMIDASAIAALDKMADRSEVAALKFRALFANIGAPIITAALDAVNAVMGSILEKLSALGQFAREQSVKGGRENIEDINAMAAKAQGRLAENDKLRAIAQRNYENNPNPATAGRLAALTDQGGAIRGELAGRDQQRDAEARRIINIAVGAPDAPPPVSLSPPVAPGAGTSGVKGAGQDEADKYAKLIEQLKLAADAQDKMTAAARSGDVAFQDQEIKLKAAEKAVGIYGQALAATDPRLQKIEELISRDTMGKAAQSYVTATTEIERQNEVLEAEIRLINATIPARAAEIALIKAKQDADKAGQALTSQDKEGRRVAIEQNERLKAQGEELKKANELWTAPLKSALESIQRVGADAFEQMLTNGNFTFQSLGDTFKKIVIRMAAEFMALATIRPVMSVLVNAVSPGMASSMGLGGGGMPSIGGGGGGGMPGVPSFGGGMSGFELPSFLGGGTIGELMAATPFASAAPAGGFADIGALMASGQAGSSAGLAAGGIQGAAQGLSVGSMLGGAMGIGMGAYSLATANGSTGKTIGGIGQMIGGGMMLIPGMQIPGMIVSALATIIPMLIPDAEKRTSSQTNASLRYGAGGYGTTGGAWGPGANVSQSQAALGSLGGNISKVFGLLGGVKDQNKVWGMDASSWTESGSNWSYTSQATDLVDPRGNRSAWRMNESNMYDTASAQVAMRSILEGAVGTISDNMRTAVTAMLPATTTLQDVAKGVVFVTDTYDQLGKAIATIRPSFENLNKQFIDMADTATALGLSLEPVKAEQAKQTTRLANDFVDGMLNPLAVQLRAFDDQRSQSLASAEYIRDNVKDVYVDIAKITEYWNRKRIDLEAQYQEASVGQLQALIRRLTYGDLANASPDTSYTGTRGTYNATLAQARAGSGVALNNLAGTAESFAGSARSFFASGPEYAAIVVQLRRDLLEVMGGGANAPASGAANGEAQSNALAQQFAELMSAFQISQQNSAALQIKIAELTAQLQRAA